MYCHITGMTLIPLQHLKGPSQNNSKVFLFSLSVIINCIPRVTQLKSWIKHHFSKIKHLNSLNQFQIWFKTRFTTKNHNAEPFCHLFSRCCHSHNRRVRALHSSKQMFFCGTELIVDHKTQTNIHFESLTIVFDDVSV